MHLHKIVPLHKINQTAKEFTGKIKQMPPIKSAVKRQLRTREIYYFNILEINDKDVLFKIGCEAGTYIRKLCLHPNTEILTNKGIMIASDFYSNPQKIFSFKEGEMIRKNPSSTQKIPSSSKLIKIIMSSGISLIVTSDHELLTSTKKGSITSVQAIYVPADDLTDPAPATCFTHLDATTVLSREIVELGIYPAVDPLDSTSKILSPQV